VRISYISRVEDHPGAFPLHQPPQYFNNMASTGRPGLAKQALLDKIDKLRELNVRDLDLPQLVVVGDQSSGKSSVLESLTGFAFPQGAGLCTRYATQISCRRTLEISVTISIIPRPGADAARIDELRGFRTTGKILTDDALEKAFLDANRYMGIKMSSDDTDPQLRAFSEDILKVEINGPDQDHFTVIDVPGIFRFPNPPLTTDSDVELVRNMVRKYMLNSRTVLLAVLPCNIDISTQEILKMATDADPEGLRTMGVLTKPDLVTETATFDAVKDLVLGRRNQLHLGYCVVRNRGADDRASTPAERLLQEKEFFSTPTWQPLLERRRCGISSLATCISDLLTNITKKELPNVRSDVVSRLEQCRRELDGLGPARTEQTAQRQFLGSLSTRFQIVTQCALSGSYDSNPVFTAEPSLKLITAVTKMNEKFANDFWKRGHKRHISTVWSNEEETAFDHGKRTDASFPEDYAEKYPELYGIVKMENYECRKPIAYKEDQIMEHIERVYQDNRGPELGTVSTPLPSLD
jgi:GTPase SAR1 family protein